MPEKDASRPESEALTAPIGSGPFRYVASGDVLVAAALLAGRSDVRPDRIAAIYPRSYGEVEHARDIARRALSPGTGRAAGTAR
jgi:hypothetical protein